MKGVEGRRTQFLDDLRSRRRYWELKEEAVEVALKMLTNLFSVYLMNIRKEY